jgi:hypothetical protein
LLVVFLHARLLTVSLILFIDHLDVLLHDEGLLAVTSRPVELREVLLIALHDIGLMLLGKIVVEAKLALILAALFKFLLTAFNIELPVLVLMGVLLVEGVLLMVWPKLVDLLLR